MVNSKNSQTSASAHTLSDDILGAVGQLIWHIFLAVLHLAWWALLFPMISLPVAASTYFAVMADWSTTIMIAVGSALVLFGWRIIGPRSFRACVSGRIWKRWRRWNIYRRRWADICALHGLTATLNNKVLVPFLRRPKIGYVTDTLTVKLLAGQTLTDWSSQADALTHTFDALSVHIRSSKPGWVTITVNHSDTLETSIQVPSPRESVSLEHVPIGITDTGKPWLVRILGRHLLVAGATGAGKGSVVWSIITGLAPMIRSGVVALWVVDPKGGMEFGRGSKLFTRFSYDTGEQTLELLRDAATILTDRANRLRGHTRQHTPTVPEPLIVIVIDELAALTAYLTDRKIKAEVEQLLGLILSQGRAAGVSVIACVQDPSKEVLALRQLFPTRIGLRLTETTQVGMVLGQGARERGALCDLIRDRLPGVGYIAEDTTTDLVRVRAFHVTDADIDRLSRDFRLSHQSDSSQSDTDPTA